MLVASDAALSGFVIRRRDGIVLRRVAALSCSL